MDLKIPNVPQMVQDKRQLKLHLHTHHPLGIVWKRIQLAMSEFVVRDSFPEAVNVTENFDHLRIGPDHPARLPRDTFYITEDTCLRTHTTVHEIPMLKEGHKQFLVCGDVYRKDNVDQYHYPIFHQVEGVRVFPPETPLEDIIIDLKKTLENVIKQLFVNVTEFRWRNYYKFPFTCPSFELDMKHQGEWVEILGSGILHPEVLEHTGRNIQGWAFGLGLERVAMILYKIPDIRLFWTDDPRFLNQFNKILPEDPRTDIIFEPYSNHPSCYKDISMWVQGDLKTFKREFHGMVRELAGDLVETIECTDKYHDVKNQRHSRCFRINYRSHERTLTNEEVNEIQGRIIAAAPQKLNVVVR